MSEILAASNPAESLKAGVHTPVGGDTADIHARTRGCARDERALCRAVYPPPWLQHSFFKVGTRGLRDSARQAFHRYRMQRGDNEAW